MKASAAASKSDISNSKSQATNKGQSVPPRVPIPMKPRKGLFVGLMVVFFAWVGVMLGMYFTTVRPRTHSTQPSPAPSRPTATAPVLAGESQ